MFFARKYNLEIIEVGSKQSIEAVTDYPLTESDMKLIEDYEKEFKVNNDAEYPTFPFRKVNVISYDRNKYCKIEYKGAIYSVKRGYCYRPNIVPIVSKWDGDFIGYKCISHKDAESLPWLLPY